MQPYPYAVYPNPNGAPIPGRYMIPANYRQSSPPFVNQSVAARPIILRPPRYAPQPLRYPPGAIPAGYRPGYPAPGIPPPPMTTMMPVAGPPRSQQLQPLPGAIPPGYRPGYPAPGLPPPMTTMMPVAGPPRSQQLQPPQPYYYYYPNGFTGGYPAIPPVSNPPTTVLKKGGKEHKNNAFTTAPDGSHHETIQGLPSENGINSLLKRKGTKVKVSKMYRITKTKPESRDDESSDDEYEQVPLESPRSRPIQQPPTARVQRAPSVSSICSHCSTCSNCSCSDCRSQKQRHTYDDCPQCRAEWQREQTRRYKRK